MASRLYGMGQGVLRLNLLLNVSLQLLDLLDEGLLASGELRDQSFLLLKLTSKLTWLEM